MARVTNDMSDLEAVPYFLWNEETTVARLREILSDPAHPLRAIYAARVMRDGRVTDLWSFLRPQDVKTMWPQVERHLGKRRAFWRFLLETWTAQGAV